MFLHNIVGLNTKKSNAKETMFFILYDVMSNYIFAKKMYVMMY